MMMPLFPRSNEFTVSGTVMPLRSKGRAGRFPIDTSDKTKPGQVGMNFPSAGLG